jgi:hypothetical protein
MLQLAVNKHLKENQIANQKMAALSWRRLMFGCQLIAHHGASGPKIGGSTGSVAAASIRSILS